MVSVACHQELCVVGVNQQGNARSDMWRNSTVFKGAVFSFLSASAPAWVQSFTISPGIIKTTTHVASLVAPRILHTATRRCFLTWKLTHFHPQSGVACRTKDPSSTRPPRPLRSATTCLWPQLQSCLLLATSELYHRPPASEPLFTLFHSVSS